MTFQELQETPEYKAFLQDCIVLRQKRRNVGEAGIHRFTLNNTYLEYSRVSVPSYEVFPVLKENPGFVFSDDILSHLDWNGLKPSDHFILMTDSMAINLINRYVERIACGKRTTKHWLDRVLDEYGKALLNQAFYVHYENYPKRQRRGMTQSSIRILWHNLCQLAHAENNALHQGF